MPQTSEPIESLSRALHAIGALQFGRFTLKDGRTSPFYVDLRILVAHPSVLRAAAAAMVEKSAGLRYDRLAGLPYAGLPIAVAMSLASDVPLVYPRKETKDYGTKRPIEGAFAPGDRVLLVDDVTTSGTAKREAAAVLRDAGLVAEDILVLVDRSPDRGESLRQIGLSLSAVMRIEDLLLALRGGQLIGTQQYDEAIAFVAGR